MNASTIIAKKRDGQSLSKEEINFIIEGYTEGSIPDYQMSALLMAIYLNKMNKEETINLTEAMKNSGDSIDLSAIHGMKVDKHSTGGIGDKTTLIVGPIAAAAGVYVAKMSGRGLGFTGGTADKLDAIPYFNNKYTPKQLTDQVNDIGIALITQTANIAPADKKIYALRDVTATVENMSLIASSIMSKKLASGDDAIVLDVKCGSGAFMEDLKSAIELSKIMVDIGNAFGKRTVAMISDMDKPLGRAVGNSLEVIESIEVLKGKGPADIREMCIELSAMMIYLAKKADSLDSARKLAVDLLDRGKALEKFKEVVEKQGGDLRIFDDYSVFPQASIKKEIVSRNEGYVNKINARKVGIASQLSGAGRMTKEESIDLACGIYIEAQIGEEVHRGGKLATVYGNDEGKVKEALDILDGAFEISTDKPQSEQIIKKIVGLD